MWSNLPAIRAPGGAGDKAEMSSAAAEFDHVGVVDLDGDSVVAEQRVVGHGDLAAE
jgi:hypothetical protein